MKNVIQHPTFSSGNTVSDEKFGNGGGGGNLEARVAKLESDVEYIKRDVSELKDDFKIFAESQNTTNQTLSNIDSKLAGIEGNFDSKLTHFDGNIRLTLAKFETGIIKWFIGTATVLAGIAFAAAALIK